MNRKGRFITVEGQDGAGKTTNLAYVRELLEQRGLEVMVTREPGGTALGEELRRMLLEGHDLRIDPVAELLMIFAARAQHLAERIIPALEAGTWVLCDRFTDATFAYQGGGRGLPVEHVRQLETLVQGSLRPDLTLLLDVDLETARTRSTEHDPQRSDRFETEHAAFKQRVRSAYLELARRHPHRIQVIDAGANLHSVRQRIRGILMTFADECT